MKSFFLFFAGVGFAFLMFLELKPKEKSKLRKQPYVYLNTEERIKKGDTLYVWSANEDTIVVY